MFKAFKKIILSAAIFAVFLGAARIGLSSKYVVPIIMYHRVESTDSPKADSVSPEVFKDQIRYLKAKGYNVMSLDELVKGMYQGKSFPQNSVVLTFDDGYENNYTHAFPVLHKYQVPATIFLSPEFVGTDGFLDWEQIHVMQEEGIAYGSHGMTQAYLPGISAKEQDYEIYQSKKVLEEKLGTPVSYFAYPVGGFNDSIKGKIVEAGYKAAFTTNRGFDKFNKDTFELNRIRLSDKDNTNLILWAKLSGYYNLFRKGKNPY